MELRGFEPLTFSLSKRRSDASPNLGDLGEVCPDLDRCQHRSLWSSPTLPPRLGTSRGCSWPKARSIRGAPGPSARQARPGAASASHRFGNTDAVSEMPNLDLYLEAHGVAAQRIARDRAQLARGVAEEIVRDEYAKRGLVIDADAVLEFAKWLHHAPDWWLRHWHGDAFEGGQIIDTITPKNRRLVENDANLKAEPVWEPERHPGSWRAVWAYSTKRAVRDNKTLTLAGEPGP